MGRAVDRPAAHACASARPLAAGHQVAEIARRRRRSSNLADSGRAITSTFPLFCVGGGAGGFDIAGVDWSDGSAESGVIDVQMIDVPGIGPVPAGSVGGHAMLVVGYDRPAGYFIVKNSWGTGFGHAGYAYLPYDYVQTYAKYGYVVMGVTPN